MKRPADLPESLSHRLNSYALAASAAGVSLLALAQPAEGKIVYTKAHVRIGVNKQYDLDLNHDGITDFRLLNSNYNGASDDMAVGVPGSNFVWMQSKTQYHRMFAKALRRGVLISQKTNQFNTSGPRFYMAAANSKSSVGPWKDVHNRYLGLMFYIKGEYHFGWARLNVSIANEKVTGVLTGYAYETIPLKPIIAGKTKGPDVIVQDASLGHLARGASAIPAWRTKQ